MASALPSPFPKRREWGAAFAALRRLMGDVNDTTQVFRIMRALNVGNPQRNYLRLLDQPGGGVIAYRHVELAERLMRADTVAGFAPGTVGAAYRDFLATTGYSADGLADISRAEYDGRDAEHPYAWFGRRIRDVHDIWHVLTGYQADEPLGEACLVAFSYAQTRGLGWAFIASAAALRLGSKGGFGIVRAIWEGYARGRRAAWLLGEDYEALLAEPLDAARARLRIAPPVRYEQARAVA